MIIFIDLINKVFGGQSFYSSHSENTICTVYTQAKFLKSRDKSILLKNVFEVQCHPRCSSEKNPSREKVAKGC